MGKDECVEMCISDISAKFATNTGLAVLDPGALTEESKAIRAVELSLNEPSIAAAISGSQLHHPE